TLPPLRERREDILPIAQHFIIHFNKELGQNFTKLTDEASLLMYRYDWPGNIRELRNVIERSMILSSPPIIGMESLPWKIKGERGADIAKEALAHGSFILPEAGVNIDEVEKELLVQALEKSGNNQTRAAKMLGLSRDALRYRMKKFELGG
ncbi:sigma-54-dependent Fis family transcriptional regulator, partial [bacterium]